MNVGDIVICKKSVESLGRKVFTVGNKYKISTVEHHDYGILIFIDGDNESSFWFDLDEYGNYNFNDYFYYLREMRKKKLLNLYEKESID